MNENFFLTFQGKTILSYAILGECIAKFREKFSSNESEIELFIEECECFLVAFFGLLSLGKKPILLQHTHFSREFIDKAKFEMIMSGESAENSYFEPNDIDKDALFYICTSGSSGVAKLVPKTLQQMLDETSVLIRTFNISSQESIISFVSNQHLYGLTFQIFLSLVSGARLERQDFDFFNFFAHFKEKDFILISSPTMLKTMSQNNDTAILKRAKMIFSAGGKLDECVREELKPCRIVEIYGGSEMGIVAHNEGLGFKAFEGVNLSVDDENKLIISSPWQKNILSDEPLLSSDIVRLNGDELTLLGRYDRILKLHEKRISLDFIEQRLKEHEFIDDARAFLANGQIRLSALLVLSTRGKTQFKKEGKRGIVEALKAHLYADFGTKVRYFKICEKLPYNAQGKLSAQACVECFDKKVEPKFELIKHSENEAHLKAYISEECFYFEGHFSNFPLVPGFCELQFVLQNARKYLNIKDFIEVENVKFLSFLQPFQHCFLNLLLKNKKLYFELFADEKKCCGGRVQVSFKDAK